MTNNRGLYEASGLEPGTVIVSYEASDMKTLSTSISLHAGDNTLDEHLVLASLDSTITVQAEKRGEELDQTPITINLLDSARAERDGVHQISDLNKDVSSFLYADLGSRAIFNTISLRGFANNSNSIDPSTAVYIDAIPINDFFSLNQQFVDIDHIEVLKGPQGALYGASSEAGVINVITHSPGNDYHGTVGGSFGSYNGYTTYASLSGPIVKDHLLLGIGGEVDGRDAFVTALNSNTGVNTQFSDSGRARLDWLPASNWRLSAVVNGTHLSDGGGYVLLPTDLATYNATVLAGQTPIGPYQDPFDISGFSKLGSNSESSQGSYFGSYFNFNGFVARREVATQYQGDGDFTPFPIYVEDFHFRHTAYNEEFRLQSPGDQTRWTWIAGTSFLNDTRRNDDTLTLVPNNILGAPVSTSGFGNPRLTSFLPAVFGQASTRFFHQKLGLTGGLRGEWVTRSLLRQPNDFGISFNGSIHESIALPSFIADYRVKPNLFVYYSIGRGWIPGGENIYAADQNSAFYKMQTSVSNEIGLKTSQFNDTITANLALYDNSIRNFQDVVYSSVTISTFGNAAKAHTRGVELEAAVQPVKHVKLGTNLGFLDARYDMYTVNAGTGLSLTGDRIHTVPNKTIEASAQIDLYKGTYVRGEWNALGSRFEYDLTSGTTPLLVREGGYGLGTIQAGYARRHASVLVFVDNLTDRRYFPIAFVGTSDAFGYFGALGAPGLRRQIGFRTTLHF